MTSIAIGLALLSAVCLGFGAERQGGAARRSDDDEPLTLRIFLHLLRNRRWLVGMVLMTAGTLLNIAALALAPITVVQPIGTLALVITTVVHARATGHRLPRRMRISVLACLLGSAGFVLLGVQVRNENTSVTDTQTWFVVILTGICVAVLGVVSQLKRIRIPAFGYVVAAGVLFGFVAVQIKLLASILLLLPHGGAATVWEWLITEVPWTVVAGIVAASVLGSWFVQKAYASGPPDLVIAGLTVIDPVVGVAIGIGVLNELKPGFPPLVGAGMALSAAVAMVGVVSLAHFHPDSDRRAAPAVEPSPIHAD